MSLACSLPEGLQKLSIQRTSMTYNHSETGNLPLNAMPCPPNDKRNDVIEPKDGSSITSYGHIKGALRKNRSGKSRLFAAWMKNHPERPRVFATSLKPEPRQSEPTFCWATPYLTHDHPSLIGLSQSSHPDHIRYVGCRFSLRGTFDFPTTIIS